MTDKPQSLSINEIKTSNEGAYEKDTYEKSIYENSTYEKKAKDGTYRKANLALGLSAMGLAIAYPFQGSFFGGLIASGCSAALVGGLADWFAVNALFRRPLGIPAGKVIRTEIIPRNRERIFQALTSMVEDELLSQEAIKQKLEGYDFSDPVLGIWSTLPKEDLEHLLAQFLQHLQESLISSLDELDLAKESAVLLADDAVRDEQILPLIQQAWQHLLNSEEGRKAFETIFDGLAHWLQDTEVHLWLTHWLDKSMERYVSQSPSRRFLTLFLPEPSQLALTLQRQLVDYLREEQTKVTLFQWLEKQGQVQETGWAQEAGQVQETGQRQEARQVQETGWTQETVQSQEIGVGTPGFSLLFFLYTKLKEPTENLSETLKTRLMQTQALDLQTMSRQLLYRLEMAIDSLNESQDKRQDFNKIIQGLLFSLLENKHQKIGQIVQEGLEKYSNERLVELIESKAGNDLQMIRINGSVVGGIAGMMIYLAGLPFH